MRISGSVRFAILATTILLVTAVHVLGAAQIQTFGVLGAGDTISNGINRFGTVTGYYVDSQFGRHGFVRSAAGRITTFDVAGASQGNRQGTFPWVINDAGEVAGTYTTSSVSVHGFLRDSSGNITTFDVPAETPASSWSAMSINNAGQIAGVSFGGTAADVYIRNSDGTFTIFNPGGGTAYVGINSLGEVVGTYADTNGTYHGFVRDPSGNLSTFDVLT
jgi:hypothetical protein